MFHVLVYGRVNHLVEDDVISHFIYERVNHLVEDDVISHFSADDS